MCHIDTGLSLSMPSRPSPTTLVPFRPVPSLSMPFCPCQCHSVPVEPIQSLSTSSSSRPVSPLPVPSLSVLSHHPYYIVIVGPASAACVTLWLLAKQKIQNVYLNTLFFVYFRITKQNKTYTPPPTHTHFVATYTFEQKGQLK